MLARLFTRYPDGFQTDAFAVTHRVMFFCSQAETLALTLISCVIQDLDPGKQLTMDQFSAIVELQYYCQVGPVM